MVAFFPDSRLDREFLFYLLIAMQPALLRATVVTTQPNINYVQIGTNYVPVPPRQEQEAIVQHIEGALSRMAVVKQSIQKQIATLQLYRKSLIHECVTGQRRVADSDITEVQAHVRSA